MNTTTSKVKLSITLNPGVANKLPKLNRSQFIESVLVKHYQTDGIVRLYEEIKRRLLEDIEVRRVLGNTTQNTTVLPKTGIQVPDCCLTKPDLETKPTLCRHWVKNEDDDFVNTISGEVVSLF